MLDAWPLWGIPLAYFLTSYLLGCLMVRMEWALKEKQGDTLTKTRRLDLQMFIFVFPFSFFGFLAHYLYMRQKHKIGPLRVMNNYLTTPRAVRKAQKVGRNA